MIAALYAAQVTLPKLDLAKFNDKYFKASSSRVPLVSLCTALQTLRCYSCTQTSLSTCWSHHRRAGLGVGLLSMRAKVRQRSKCPAHAVVSQQQSM